jgi:hypothetical protein
MILHEHCEYVYAIIISYQHCKDGVRLQDTVRNGDTVHASINIKSLTNQAYASRTHIFLQSNNHKQR